MVKEHVIFTKEGLEELDNELSYMIYGQGFLVCIVDTKHTRRRTLGNLLRTLGVENIVEAGNYAQAKTALKGKEDKKNIIITDFDIGKVNGLKLISEFLKVSKSSRGILIVDKVHPKLRAIIDLSKAISLVKRPFKGEDIIEIIKDFDFPL